MALDFFAGCVGGCAGVLVGHPFDTIKVRLQTQDAARPLYKGTMDCLQTTLRHEKFSGLYKGVTSPLCGVAFVNAIVFGVYGAVLRLQADPSRPSSQMMAGAIAGAAQSVVCGPVELAKTRLQIQTGDSSSGSQKCPTGAGAGATKKPMGPLQCLIQIGRSEGIRGVFRGLGVTIAREVPSCAIYFASYELMTQPSTSAAAAAAASGKPHTVSTGRMLIAGGLAGTLSWVLTYPIDVVKSRVQADGQNCSRKYRGAIDCFRQSLSSEGAAFMVRGLSSTILRAFPTNAATFTVVGWVFRAVSVPQTPPPPLPPASAPTITVSPHNADVTRTVTSSASPSSLAPAESSTQHR